VDLPPGLVQHETEHILEELAQALGPALRQGAREDLETLHRQAEEMGRRRVRGAILLEAIARQEGLTVGDEEVEAEVKQMASVLRQDAAALRKTLEADGRLESIRARLLEGLDGLGGGVGARSPVRVGVHPRPTQPFEFLQPHLLQPVSLAHVAVVPFRPESQNAKAPHAGSIAQGALSLTQPHLILIMRKVRIPAGASTRTSSPARLSNSARPSGDSLEIRPSLGSASAAPTIV